MAKRKTPLSEYHRRARIGVVIAFDGFRPGTEYEVHVDEVVAGWLALGLVEILEELGGSDGTAEAGSGGPVEDVLVDE